MLLAFVVTFSTSLAAQAERIEAVKFAYRIKNKTIVGNGVFDKPAPRFAELAAQGQGWKTPADALSAILRKSPELSNQFVLVHNSESQQPSSLEFPRIVLFGGGMSYSFSEHPSQRVQRIEVMEVDERTQGVSFHEIVFENGAAKFESNPKSCVACHGTPARPIWNPYDFWPNAYGSFAGFATTKNEVDAYAKLRRASSASPILKQLKMPRELSGSDDRISAFSQFVTQVHFARWIVDEIGTRSLNGFEKPLLAVLGQCPADIKTFFRPEELTPEMTSRLDALLADTRADRKGFKDYLDKFQRRAFPSPLRTTFPVDHQRLAQEADLGAKMRWILDLAGIRTENLSPSLVANDSINSTPLNFTLDFLTALFALRPDLFTDVSWEPQDLYTGVSAFMSLDCAKLKNDSRKAVRTSSSSQWLKREEVKQGRGVISRCAKCHVEHIGPMASAPSLPFSDPVAMTAKLRSSDFAQRAMMRARDRGGPLQMPPGKPLSDEEILALESYLEALK